MSDLFNSSDGSLFFALLAVVDLKAFYKGTVSAIVPFLLRNKLQDWK